MLTCPIRNYSNKVLITFNLDELLNVKNLDELTSLVNEKLETLKDVFSLSYETSKDPEEYDESILKLARNVSNILQEEISKLSEGDIKNIFDSRKVLEYIISKYSRPLTETEKYIKEVLADVDITPINEIDKISFNTEIKRLYKNNQAINDNRLRIFNNLMRTAFIIDVKSKKIVDNLDDIGESIRNYLEDLFKIIKIYLQAVGFKVPPTSMFELNSATGGYSLNPSYKNVMLMMYHQTKAINIEDSLMNSWMNASTKNGDKGFLFEAINAYINTLYFDDVLKEGFSEFIDIDKNLNVPVQVIYNNGEYTSQYKYKFSSKEKFKGKNNWDDSILDAITSVSKLLKVLIESIPVYDYINGDYVRMMTAKDFIGSMASLLHAGVTISTSGIIEEEFVQAIKNYNTSTKEPIIKILDILFNRDTKIIDKLKNTKLLDNNTFNSLFSIYKTLFKGDTSWDSIEDRYITEKGYTSRIPIIDTLLGVINSNVLTQYLQTSWDNGRYITKVKSRILTDRSRFDIFNDINLTIIDRKDKPEVLKLYKLKKGENRDYTITIGDFSFTASPREIHNILTKETALEFNGLLDIVNSKSLLSTHTGRLKLLGRENLTLNLENFLNLLLFIDSMLSTSFSNGEDGLIKLHYILKESNANLNYIISSAVRGLVVIDAYNQFSKSIDPSTNKPYLASLFTKFLGDNEDVLGFKITNKLGRDRKKYFINNVGVGELLTTVSNNELWISALSTITAILNGSSSVSVINNLEGDKIPVYSPAFLGANIHLLLNDSFNNSSSTQSLLFVNNLKAIKNIVINTDILSANLKTKSIKTASLSELVYDSIINKFILPLIDDNTVYVLPTVFSDKTKFLLYQIALGDLGLDINTTEDLIISKMINTIGKAYLNVWTEIEKDYAAIFEGESQYFTNGKINISEVLKYLKTHNEELFTQKANDRGVTVYRDTHYRIFKGGLSINELAYHYGNNLYNKDSLRKRLNRDKLEFLNTLFETRFGLKVKYNDEGNLDGNDSVTRLFLKLVPDNLRLDWIVGNNLIIAKAYNSKTGSYRNIYNNKLNANETLVLNPILEKYFLFDNLLGNNLRFSLTGSEINHKIKTLKNIDEVKIGNTRVFSDSKYQDFVKRFSPTYDGGFISYFETLEALNNAKNSKLSQLDLVTFKELSNLYEDLIYITENGGLNALFKRNVIIPGTMRYYLLDTLYGIRDRMKVAIIKDMPASVFNFYGPDKDIDAHDGSAFINPFISILENLSLLDSAVGNIKKPIHHWYDDRFMTSTLFKYAVDTITNRWMLQSEGNSNGITLKNLFKKMTDLQWTEPIDLFRCDYRSRKYQFKRDILCGDKLFYKDGNLHVEIIDFNIENGVYYTIERIGTNSSGVYNEEFGEIPETKVYHYFNENGEHIKSYETPKENIEGLHTINSLYELHTALGGIYSESIIDGQLDYSEISNMVVTRFINYAAVRKEGVPENAAKTLSNYYQPLKDKMIDMVANNSSIKNGAGNINLTSSFYDDTKLRYITVGTKYYGILMDADHEADEGLMTEFSQVISSLDAGGRLHEYVSEIYEALGLVAIDLAQVELDASTDKSKLYTIVGRTIINNIANNNQANLAEAILDNVKEEFDKYSDLRYAKSFIPFSDPNIYSSILSTFVSTINKKSIKRKYPGQGTVMVPAYNMSMIYDINGERYLYLDLLKEAINQGYTSDKLDISLKNREIVSKYLLNVQAQQTVYTDTSIFLPTENILVNFTALDKLNIPVIYSINVSLNEIHDYYNFKDNPIAYLESKGYRNISNITFLKNVLVPRNLAPAKISWDYIDSSGKVVHMNIFDHWRVKSLILGLKAILEDKTLDKELKLLAEERIRAEYNILQAFDELEKGLYIIDGVPYIISNLKNKAAEIITSNLFKTRFNLKQGDSLIDVKREGVNYFRDDYEKIQSDNYDLLFTSRDGEHLCISFNPISEKTDTFDYRNRAWDNILLKKYEYPVNYKGKRDIIDSIYYMDKNNIPLFEVGRTIVNKDVYFDNKTLKFKLKGSNIDARNLSIYIKLSDNTVLEKVFFVNRYSITEIADLSRTYPLYSINNSLLRKVFAFEDYSKELLEKPFKDLTGEKLIEYNRERLDTIDLGKFVGKLLFNMYHSRDFSGIQLNNSLTIPSKKSLVPAMINLQGRFLYDLDLSNYIGKLNTILSEALSSTSIENGRVELKARSLRRAFGEFQDLVAKKRYTSFLKSLMFTASRIPALTLQSFMLMENVGYTGVNNNQCFVTHWLTWLKIVHLA